MAFRLLDKATAIGASKSVKVASGVINHTVDVELDSRAAVKISAATVVLQGSAIGTDSETGVITTPSLAIGSTAERVANGLFYFRINGTNYTKAAVAAGSVFTAAHVVSASKYGVIMIYINASGTIISLVPLATQAYDTAEAAHDAGDAMITPNSYCYLGRILVASDAGAWTANTDDLTNASDLTTATFISATSSFFDLQTYPLNASDITAGRAMFHVSNKSAKYVRVFLSALTGTGEVTVRYMPVENWR